MIASVGESLFSAVEETSLALLALFEICAEGRHLLLTRPILDRSTVIRAWIDRLPRRARAEIDDLLQRSIEASAQAPVSTKRIKVDAVPACQWAGPVLDLRSALRVLRMPLRLLVEDRYSDGAFVRKMITPDRKPLFDRALAASWIEFEHGGGGRLRRRVEDVAADPAARARVWVMSDSDAQKRGDQRVTSRTARTVPKTAGSCIPGSSGPCVTSSAGASIRAATRSC